MRRKERDARLLGKSGGGQERNPQHSDLVEQIRFLSRIARRGFIGGNSAPVADKLRERFKLRAPRGEGSGLRVVFRRFKRAVVEQKPLASTRQNSHVSLVEVICGIGAVGIEPPARGFFFGNVADPAKDEEAFVLLLMTPTIGG